MAGLLDQAEIERVAGAVGDLSKLLALKTAARYTGKSMAERQAQTS